ncbi:auxin-binding protein ABP19b-like [Abrus precatorius]|uniref:Germin-like protein n=1 Tax=Abrus precatorius TaxID=3816 RepID=A0A8B8K0N3_ABRPR|nr:auxin-binding protein ABP19b-like [Abrus precatorius]
MVLIIFLFALISSTTSRASNANDFCVANLTGPETPSGYLCKSTNTVTSSDFKYSGLTPGNPSSTYNIALTTAFVDQFPAVNGLYISMARVDMGVGGVVPVHTHPGGNEMILVLQGKIIAGFITSTNVYMNILGPGDVMVFPQGQLHFQINNGTTKAVVISAYSSPRPRINIVLNLLFANLPADIIAAITKISPPEVQKLKAQFGGSG